MSETNKILIADDDEMVVSLLEEVLQSAGYQTLKAVNGKQTLEMVEKEHPHLLLLDIGMPELDGMQACHEIRASSQNANLAIAMITGKAEASSIVEALESGADDYIAKPFENDDLLAKVKILIEQAKTGALPSQLSTKK